MKCVKKKERTPIYMKIELNVLLRLDLAESPKSLVKLMGVRKP